MIELEAFIQSFRGRTEKALEQWLIPSGPQPTQLEEAMRYTTLNGGKRIRPLLVYATGQIFSDDITDLDYPACAVEFAHCYSLIHDDLPCMDDDDLRRGQPTCHKAFDEATAVLTGDALQALAFEVLANTPINSAALVSTLAHAVGPRGMVGGQSIDILAMGTSLKLEELEHMHSMKTGALIEASIVLGALTAGCEDESHLGLLKRFAQKIGLAFQVQDDVIDIEGETQIIGKTQGADAARNKPTYPGLIGLEAAKQKAQDLQQQAKEALEGVPYDTSMLEQLSEYIVLRNY